MFVLGTSITLFYFGAYFESSLASAVREDSIYQGKVQKEWIPKINSASFSTMNFFDRLD